MATKAQLEAQLAELAAQVGTTEPTPKEAKRVKIPAWAASSKSEVIGVDTSTGNAYVCVARRDGDSPSPRHSEKANGGKGGPAKARRFAPETLAYILDNADQMRKLITACEKLNA